MQDGQMTSSPDLAGRPARARHRADAPRVARWTSANRWMTEAAAPLGGSTRTPMAAARSQPCTTNSTVRVGR